MVLAIEPRAEYMLGKDSSPELHPHTTMNLHFEIGPILFMLALTLNSF